MTRCECTGEILDRPELENFFHTTHICAVFPVIKANTDEIVWLMRVMNDKGTLVGLNLPPKYRAHNHLFTKYSKAIVIWNYRQNLLQKTPPDDSAFHEISTRLELLIFL